MNSVLSIERITKKYGHLRAVDQLDLEVEKGSVFGLLGPNGSGKTTTLGIILDIIKPNEGNFRWFGEEPSHQSRKKIGGTLEHPIFYPYLSAVSNLKIIARIKEKPFDGIENILKTVELFDRKDDNFRTFSLGMKQRLAIASALIGNPEVLILDEPTNGLDPQGIAEIRNLVIKIANEGITVILASHLLDEVQKMCTHVAVLKKGKKLYSGPVDEVLAMSDTIELASNDLEILSTVLTGFEGIKGLRKEGNLLVAKCSDGVTATSVNEFLIQKGIVLSHLNLRKKSLEDQFLEILHQSK